MLWSGLLLLLGVLVTIRPYEQVWRPDSNGLEDPRQLLSLAIPSREEMGEWLLVLIPKTANTFAIAFALSPLAEGDLGGTLVIDQAELGWESASGTRTA